VELVLLVFGADAKERYTMAAIATITIKMTTGTTLLIPLFLSFIPVSASKVG
jgi:hypothetical protein